MEENKKPIPYAVPDPIWELDRHLFHQNAVPSGLVMLIKLNTFIVVLAGGVWVLVCGTEVLTPGLISNPAFVEVLVELALVPCSIGLLLITVGAFCFRKRPNLGTKLYLIGMPLIWTHFSFFGFNFVMELVSRPASYARWWFSLTPSELLHRFSVADCVFLVPPVSLVFLSFLVTIASWGNIRAGVLYASRTLREFARLTDRGLADKQRQGKSKGSGVGSL